MGVCIDDERVTAIVTLSDAGMLVGVAGVSIGDVRVMRGFQPVGMT